MPEWLINLGYAALACLTVGFILAFIRVLYRDRDVRQG